ncbi:MAG TPA: hypothetical protein V6D16_04715 [Candidatus Obscuribacterales bacterium]
MSIQKLPLEAVQKVRQYIKSTLALPESENYPKPHTLFDTSEETPEPESLDALGDLFKVASLPEEEMSSPNTEGRWFVSAVNPAATLLKLPGLKLKPNFRLAGYLYRVPEGGVGSIWALPEEFSTTAHLEKALASSGDRTQPPQPSGALADFMEAVEGDRSASSYLVASILRRELQEFGVLGKYCEWSHHHLINAIPPQINWQWRKEAPKELTPKVANSPDGRIAVEFFTCRVVPPVALFRHLDQYAAGTYKATCTNQALAIKA